jgi:hypothetical protein
VKASLLGLRVLSTVHCSRNVRAGETVSCHACVTGAAGAEVAHTIVERHLDTLQKAYNTLHLLI